MHILAVGYLLYRPMERRMHLLPYWGLLEFLSNWISSPISKVVLDFFPLSSRTTTGGFRRLTGYCSCSVFFVHVTGKFFAASISIASKRPACNKCKIVEAFVYYDPILIEQKYGSC